MQISLPRLASVLVAALAFAASAPALAQKVKFVTSAGDIVVEARRREGAEDRRQLPRST